MPVGSIRGLVGRISRTCHVCAHICVYQCVRLRNQSLGPAPSRSLPRVERSHGHGTAASSPFHLCIQHLFGTYCPCDSLVKKPSQSHALGRLHSHVTGQRRVRTGQLKNQPSVTTRPRGSLQTPKRALPYPSAHESAGQTLPASGGQGGVQGLSQPCTFTKVVPSSKDTLPCLVHSSPSPLFTPTL